ncbi:MAG: metallopeptidase TldD-related protein [Dictyoglomaceae bacterium]
MIEKLMEIARKYCDEVEIYEVDYTADGVSFENGILKEIDSTIQAGISLRIIKEGKLGFAYTKNLIDPEDLVKNALDSLKGEVEAKFSFPYTKNIINLNTYDPEIENLNNSKLVEECKRISDILSEGTKTQVNVSAVKNIVNIRLMNSNGTNLSTKISKYQCFASAMYPGSYSAVYKVIVDKKFREFSKEDFNYIINLFNSSKKEVKTKGGKIKTLFLSNSLYVLIWRFIYATNGKYVYQKTSPLINKIGEKIFDSSITIYDDPLNDNFPDARSFDDEGVPCKYFPLVENGVLKNFYYDLYYAGKMNVNSTGHGYKTWERDIVRATPSPSLEHLFVKPGDKSLEDLIKLMDRGIIVADVLGAHSGNIPNGDFSVGLSPGLYVENGEIIGHVKDAMVAGNIYEVMKNVIGIENQVYPAYMGTFPSILFENVSFAVKE